MSAITVISFLSDVETPVSLFYKVSQGEDTAFLLESTESGTRLARFSFIGISPVKTVRFKDGMAVVTDHRDGSKKSLPFENPLEILRREGEETDLFEFGKIQPFPFTGGWVGYLGYGATQYFDRIPQQSEDPLNVPEGYYGLYDTVLLFDHLYRRIHFISNRHEPEARALWRQVSQRISHSPLLPPLVYQDDFPDEQIYQGVQTSVSKETFLDGVLKGKQYIQEGQIFQIVLSQRFSLPVNSPPLNMYRMIQAINPSPYAYFLKFPEFSYLGSSPETFVSCLDNTVVLRALAGTRPRGATEAEDLALAAELRENEKELAEHRMLVDLGRNDLGRVCRVGTIEVGEIATITKYTHVMHLATELSGQLKPEKTAYEVFKSCFPRGTVSGAPKIRAMQLLAELEPERRGVYSGAVGYFDLSGNMDAAIAIRSALIKDGMAHVQAGAGVVYDSDPEAEYEETRNKARSILKAIQISERSARHAVGADR